MIHQYSFLKNGPNNIQVVIKKINYNSLGILQSIFCSDLKKYIYMSG